MLNKRFIPCILALAVMFSALGGMLVSPEGIDPSVGYEDNIYFENGDVFFGQDICFEEEAYAVADDDVVAGEETGVPKVAATNGVTTPEESPYAVSPNAPSVSAKATYNNGADIAATTISADTTWTINGSVDITGQIVINSGKRLTIEAGTGVYNSAYDFDVVRIISKVDGKATFYVKEGGELVIKGINSTSSTVEERLYITGSGGDYRTNAPLIQCVKNDSATVGTVVILRGVDFRNNSNTTGYGGAISFDGNFARLEINNANFFRCASRGGGAIIFDNDFRSDGDANGDYREVLFKNISFSECYATDSGGAVSVREGNNGGDSKNLRFYTLTFSGCSFSNCYTGNRGGGIYINGITEVGNSKYGTRFSTALNMTNCTFNNCRAGYLVDFDYDGAASRGSGEANVTEQATGNYGGAAYINCRAKVYTVTGCSFTNCVATAGGAAVHFASDYVSPNTTFSGCTFTNCRCPNVTTTADSNGGTIRTVGEVTTIMTVTGCTFKGNYSRKNGGGIYWNAAGTYTSNTYGVSQSKCIITGCTFDSNWCYKDGGAVFCESVLSITGENEFKNNMAGYNYSKANSGSNGRGGAILQKVYEGSARYIEANESTVLTLSPETIIHNNTATNSGGGIGIYANETAKILTDAVAASYTVSFSLNGAQLYSNTAKQGGGLYFGSEDSARAKMYTKYITLNSGSIYNNTATNLGGGVYMNGATATINISSASVYGNTVTNHGGGIYLTGESALINITGGAVYSNTASGNGGGIYLTGAKAKVVMSGGIIGGTATDGTKRPNVASGNGGGIYLDATTIDFSGGNIDCNGARYGGGVYAHGAAVANIEGNSSISYNYATSSGGGVYAHQGSKVTITNGAVNYNTATIVAGGIRVYGATLNLSGGTVSHNTSVSAEGTGNGGGIFADHGSIATTVKITGGEITDNVAGSNGGGVHVGQNCTFTLNGGDILRNTATSGNGGGVCAATGSIFNFENGNIGSASAGNSAGNSGGGVFATTNTSLTVKNGNIGYNTAVSHGGGVFLTGATFTLSNGNVLYNTSTGGQGGGIYIDASTLTYTGGDIYENNSAQDGGGMYAKDMVSFTLSGGNIYSNDAGYDNGSGVANIGSGGGIYLFRSSLAFSGGSVYENTASYRGGGLVVNGSTLDFSGGNVNDNISEESGGGIFVSAYAFEDTAVGTTATAEVPYTTSVTVTGGNIEGNRSTTAHGGGIYACDYRTTVYNVGTVYTASVSIQTGNITENLATENGGGINTDGCPVTVSGGNISNNQANNGGGIYAAGANAVVLLSGGDIAENIAAENGGGAYIAADGVLNLTDVNSAVSANVAAQSGGGVYVYDGFITMSGGNFESNVATGGNGGAIAAISSTPTAYTNMGLSYTVTLQSGTITANSASAGFGGAIYSEGAALYIGSDSGEGGDIVRNSAKNGGGVAITGGGLLEMYNGYVRHNTAKGQPDEGVTTAYLNHQELGGVGGGIYISNGVESVVSAYMLSGSKVGIYGNLADFAADDVFANGSKTKLTLVRVDGMTIEEVGYERVTGWFEDYANGDTAYGMGLYGNPVVQGIRYRDARTTVEAYIDDAHYIDKNGASVATFALNPDGNSDTMYVRSYINTVDNYVAITLGTAKAGYGRLSIQKMGQSIDPTQVFVFLIESTSNVSGQPISFKVTVTGENAVTIMDVPDGTYTITEIESWSWRYKIDEGSSIKQTVVIGQGSGASLAPTVEFVNNLVKDKWLDSNSPIAKNVAGPVTVATDDEQTQVVYWVPKKEAEAEQDIA